MFCCKCGRDVGDFKPFCQFCGAKLTATPEVTPPLQRGVIPERVSEHGQKPGGRRKAARTRLKWVALALLVVFLCLYLYRQPTETTLTQTSAAPGTPTPENAPTQTTSAVSPTPIPDSSPPRRSHVQTATHAIGESFSVGYWSYLCNGAYWTTLLGFDQYSIERPNGEFVVVDITVRDDDNSASTVPPFHLADTEGRIYDESSAGMLSQGFFSVLETLNPGISKRAHIAFDVPPDRQYVLVVSGGIESSEKAIVRLPMSVPRSEQQTPPATQ